MNQLSIIIITYDRPNDVLELLKNIEGQENAVILVSEVIIVNNASNADYSKVEQFIYTNTALNYKYFNLDKNLGVAKGRNYAIRQSSAPFLFLLDDDAVLKNTDAVERVLEVFSSEQNRNLGALACNVLYYDTGEMQQSAFPHKRFKEFRHKEYFDTYYFTGCAHVLRREALQQAGLFPEDFFYGMEEYDLAYRFLNAGYRISYTSKIILLHKESPLGRPPKAEKLRMMWVNKSKVAWRYLRFYHFLSTALIWALYTLKKSNWNWKEFIKGGKMILQTIRMEKRHTLKPTVFKYLNKLKPRLWY